MSRFLAAFLAGFLAAVAWAGSPAMDRLLVQVQQLEEQIPGYGGTYYDEENHEIVIRIVPRLNPKLASILGEQANGLPLGRELRLPRKLAHEYERIVREHRLGPHYSEVPVRFEVGKYTWSQHFEWQKKIARFFRDPKAMAKYGYPEWPLNCFQSSFFRFEKEDVSYVFVLKDACDKQFYKDFLRAINEQLDIPTDAVGFLWLSEPLRLVPGKRRN